MLASFSIIGQGTFFERIFDFVKYQKLRDKAQKSQHFQKWLAGLMGFAAGKTANKMFAFFLSPKKCILIWK